MRITFLVNHDLPALLALNHLLPSLKQHNIIVFFSLKNSSIKNNKLAELAEFDSQQLSDCWPLASFSDVGAKQLNQVNTVGFQQFCATKPDLVVSIRYMTILKEAVINTPRLGIMNLHSGPLPSYQGVMATFWGLLNKESQIGTTLHFIEDNEVDTGSIILSATSKANYQRSYLWNVLNIYRRGCDNIIEAVTRLSAGERLMSKSQSGTAHYYGFPSADIVRDCGFRLFHQSDNAAEFFESS
ncbi:MAG: methionyl-tRNA formyltransferase [Arenicella sp.]